MPDPVQTAVMIPAQKVLADDFILAINSLRKQTHIPWIVHIMDFGGWTQERFGAREAIRNLQLFCPQVRVITYPEDYDMVDAFLEVKNHLDDYHIPAIVLVTRPLTQHALWEVSYPFLNPKIDSVPGRYDLISTGKGWFGRLWYRLSRRARHDLVAYRNHNYDGSKR